MRWFGRVAVVGATTANLCASPAAAEECTQPRNPIETDRPDTTNSAIVVPVGSLQNENGINISWQNGSDIFGGTNSRWRLGIAPCLEVLIDLPNYVGTLRGASASGFGDVTPGVKWQVSPIPEKFDLSITAGIRLPTGAKMIAGPGAQPYTQFPWSFDLGGGWAVNGMETNFFMPSSPTDYQIQQSIDPRARERDHGPLLSVHRICRRLSASWRPEPPVQFRRRLPHHGQSADRLPPWVRPQQQCPSVCLRPGIFVSSRWPVLNGCCALRCGRNVAGQP
jgi:Putative MetA-pathway of phenol degradation